MQKKPGEETLIRYFLGKCSPEEENVIQAYIALKIEPDYIEACLREAFYQQENPNTPADDQPDRDRVWNRLVAKQQELAVTRLKPRRRWYGYAAAIVFMAFSVGLLFLLKDRILHPSEKIAWQHLQGETGHVKTLTLADRSMIILFPGTIIDIPSNFNRADRQVRLHGRAFFRVADNKEKPFYVSANKLTTKVLGTSFEVNSSGDRQVITLHTGKVSIVSSDKEIARLSPDQQLNYQQATGKYAIASVDASGTLNWTQGEMDYDRVPLRDIISDMEKWYGVAIRSVAPSLLDQKVIFSFKDQPLDRVLSLLSKSADFSYDINGKHVILKERSMKTDN